MQIQRHHFARSFNFAKVPDGTIDSAIVCLYPRFLPRKNHLRVSPVRPRTPSFVLNVSLDSQKTASSFQLTEVKSASHESLEVLDDDDEICPVECVREFKTDKEFFRILEKAKETGTLVVVDFYRTACGSCKYIEQGFSKLCKGSGDQEAAVIFLKHNVIDEYDEQSEVAERLRIKAVPLFHFYKDGLLLEAFPTRDKDKVLAAILKYTSTSKEI